MCALIGALPRLSYLSSSAFYIFDQYGPAVSRLARCSRLSRVCVHRGASASPLFANFIRLLYLLINMTQLCLVSLVARVCPAGAFIRGASASPLLSYFIRLLHFLIIMAQLCLVSLVALVCPLCALAGTLPRLPWLASFALFFDCIRPSCPAAWLALALCSRLSRFLCVGRARSLPATSPSIDSRPWGQRCARRTAPRAMCACTAATATRPTTRRRSSAWRTRAAPP